MVSPVGDNFFVEATAGRLFLVCPYIPAISTHYLCFHKPCRGRRPRRPAPPTFRLQSHLYYPHNVALHKFWIIQTISPRVGRRISAKQKLRRSPT